MKKIAKHVKIDINAVIGKSIDELQKEDEETYNRLIDRMLDSGSIWLSEVLKDALNKEDL